MAFKKPVVLYSDSLKEIQSGDTLSAELTTPSMADIWAYNQLGASAKGAPLFTSLQLTANNTFAAGVRYVMNIVPKAGPINGVTWLQTTTGAYTATAYNGVMLFSANLSTGLLTLVASSTDDGTIWKGSTGINTKNFSSSYNSAPGIYFIGASYNQSAQTTAPVIGSATTLVNSAAAQFGYGNSLKTGGSTTAITTPPGTIASSSITISTGQYGFWLI